MGDVDPQLLREYENHESHDDPQMNPSCRFCSTYYPHYRPKDLQRFLSMLTVFRGADTREQLNQLVVMYIFDMSYAREDIATAQGRVEREKGWHRR